jgi:hypothetical protein
MMKAQKCYNVREYFICSIKLSRNWSEFELQQACKIINWLLRIELMRTDYPPFVVVVVIVIEALFFTQV